jgi:hypothetical protein
MPDLVERVVEKVRQLPFDQQREVLDFAEFLQRKQLQVIDDDLENIWLTSAATSPSLAFLQDEAEDVYGPQDGKPYTP